MSVAHHGSPADATPFAGIRTILVPPDIVAVTRRSSARRVEKKPPWFPRPDSGPTERTGGGQWLDERLFIEPRRDRIRSSLVGSAGVHVLAATVVLVLAAQVEHTPVATVQPRLVIATAFIAPTVGAPRAPRSGHSPGPSRAAEKDAIPPPAPVEIPSSVEPESDDEGTVGVEGGIDRGGAGGNEGSGAGGFGEGPAGAVGSSGTASSGPLRLGNTLAPPRKIKDVKPRYPQLARALQARGTVIIEITIGTDGKVQDTTVIHSVPELDQAALEAVRQWEYEPTRVNGTLVALTMTVVINFAVQ